MLNLEESVIIAGKINKETPKDSILAIPYSYDDSDLIGTFVFENNNYAIAYLEQHNPITILSAEEQVEFEKKDFLSNSFHLMSDYVKFKIQKDFGDSTFIYKAEDGKIFSKIDLKFLDKNIINSLKPLVDSLSGEPLEIEHFFKTDKAIQFILDIYMDRSDRQDFQEKIDKVIPNIKNTVLNSLPTKEKPVILDLVGIDDISFTKTFSTIDEAISLLNNIAENGHKIVLKEMVPS